MSGLMDRTGWWWRKRRWILGVSMVLLAVRLVLPYVLLRVLNDRLAKVPNYYGHADDLDLALLRGAYRIEGIFLDRVDSVSHDRTGFLAAELIDLSLEWKALFHGAVVGEVVIQHPEVYFTKDKVEPAAVQKDTASLGDLLDDLMPLNINRVEAHHGEVHYRDRSSTPPLDLKMDAVEVLAKNLRNSYDSTVVLPASVVAEARVYGGVFDMRMRLNPLELHPTFDMDLQLENMVLSEFNPFFQAYANADVNQGTFGLYSEIATREREFAGYVKPIVKDLDVLGPEDKEETFLRKVWEGIVGTTGKALTNRRHDQVATKLEFSGKLDDPDTHTWYAVVDLLRNAFIRAIQPTIDREISIANVAHVRERKAGFFERLFGRAGERTDER